MSAVPGAKDGPHGQVRFAAVTGRPLPGGNMITLVYDRGHHMFPPSLDLKVT